MEPGLKSATPESALLPLVIRGSLKGQLWRNPYLSKLFEYLEKSIIRKLYDARLLHSGSQGHFQPALSALSCEVGVITSLAIYNLVLF